VTKDFLLREYKRAKGEKVTPNCRQSCFNCGAKVFAEGACPALNGNQAIEEVPDESEN
jgi:hypothetical protein